MKSPRDENTFWNTQTSLFNTNYATVKVLLTLMFDVYLNETDDLYLYGFMHLLLPPDWITA